MMKEILMILIGIGLGMILMVIALDFDNGMIQDEDLDYICATIYGEGAFFEDDRLGVTLNFTCKNYIDLKLHYLGE